MTDRLLDGVRRFRESAFPARKAAFEELAGGQSPHTLWITCSDSRVDPSLITQSEPGELFVLRNAGNFVPPYASPHHGEAATIEYAVRALGVRHIVVCGHSDCGAVKGALNPSAVQALPAVAEWLRLTESLRDDVDARFAQADDAERLERAVQQNALDQLERLKTHPSVADALESGSVELHAWYYRIPTGEMLACTDLDAESAPPPVA